MEVQPDQPLLREDFSQRAPSLPRTTTSITPLLGEVAAGDEVSIPLRDCQPDHDVPVYHLCQRAPSVPRTKTSRRLPCAEAAGDVPDGIVPPMEVHVLHEEPPLVVVFSQRALSLPRTTTSITPLLGEVAAGDEVSIPPRDVDADHVAPFQCFH